MQNTLADLAADLVTSGCVRFGEFKLKSGLISPFYLDMRRLVSYPDALRRVARAYAGLLGNLSFDRLVGIPYAALPIGTAVALEMNRPLIYPRREAKEYGTRASIEGVYEPGEVVAIIDDLATTGETKIETIRKLEEAGLVVRDIIVLIDREQGAPDTLGRAGYAFHAVAKIGDLLDAWRDSRAISEAQYNDVRAYLDGSF
ncbi:MAG: orotate phosphoribosyltransferase [Chloroflexi bacterium]|nr:orotate phosphoribosyltransferase [Chloroflexota bacterium]